MYGTVRLGMNSILHFTALVKMEIFCSFRVLTIGEESEFIGFPPLINKAFLDIIKRLRSETISVRFFFRP